MLDLILKILSKGILWRYKPIVIGIAGEIGKTSAKEAVYTVLKSKFSVKANQGKDKQSIFLTILGCNPFLSIFKILIKQKYPQILVLELNQIPSDIKYFTEFIPFRIGVITAIGEIPPQPELFAGPIEKTKEEIILLKKLGPQDFAILNYDDLTVFEMKEKTRAYIITFGLGWGAELRATNYEILNNPLERGITFKIEFEGNIVPVRIFNTFGKPQVYAALAAAAVGVTLDFNLIEVSQALKNYQVPPGRMKLIEGIKKALIIDDSYDASPFSMLSAFETLKEIESKRKIAVLGDILGIGKYTEQTHRYLGEKVVEAGTDVLFTVGLRAKFIAQEAKIRGLPEEKIFQFKNPEEAGLTLQKEIKKDDLILIKGSREMHLEKIVKEIMAEPEKAQELLVGS